MPQHTTPRQRSDPAIYKTPIEKAIAMGSNAPNPHNTQAWKLRLVSDLEALLYIDETRILPETDPPTRQIHIGAGCFLETLSIGASAMGYVAAIDYFPEGTYSTSDVGKKPVARIKLAASAASPDSLGKFIYKRQTNRRPSFKNAAVTNEQFAQLAAYCTDDSIKMIGINSHAEMQPLLSIFEQAMLIECQNYHLFEETRIWFRYNERERAEKRDGLSIPQTGITGIRVPLVEWYLKHGDPKRWHSTQSIAAYMDVFRKGLKSAQGIMLLKSDTNTPLDWVKTGRLYVRISLAATKMGLQLHPYSQVLQEYPEMTATQQAFNSLVGVSGQQKVQMAVRIGSGPTPYYTYRREEQAMLDHFAK